MLYFLERKVDGKLNDIFPSTYETFPSFSIRIKRGLVNGLGSIFEAITGNLDARDGERFESLISELQNNQNKISEAINSQSTLSVELIDNFNKTISQVTHNQLVLENKIKKLSSYLIETQAYERNSILLRDTITEIIYLYQVIISILHDVKNSISFAKLGIMHPSIIKLSYLMKALNSIAPKSLAGKLPIEVTLDNISIFEKLIKISCYTVHRKVVYILHVPIVYPSQFDYYHLYAIPIFHKSQFKAVIPSGKYLVKNELHYAFAGDKCTEMVPKLYICNEMDLRRIEKTNPCEVQILESRSPTSCQEVDAVITEPMMKRLHDSRQWILLIPTETTITLRCEKGQEVTRVLGSYLVEIPTGCTLQLNEDWITNQEPVSIGNQPILFSNINVNISLSNPKNFTLQLDQVELDEIHKIRRRIIDNRVDIHSVKVSHIPSFWTIILYGVLLMIVCCFVFKKITPRCFKPKLRSIPKEEIDLSNVHLPR
nr:unnamed protein product [Callosobruchus analis]